MLNGVALIHHTYTTAVTSIIPGTQLFLQRLLDSLVEAGPLEELCTAREPHHSPREVHTPAAMAASAPLAGRAMQGLQSRACAACKRPAALGLSMLPASVHPSILQHSLRASDWHGSPVTSAPKRAVTTQSATRLSPTEEQQLAKLKDELRRYNDEYYNHNRLLVT